MEFTINNKEFRAAKLDVFIQFKVARKLLPVLAEVFNDVRNGSSIESALPSIALAISSLSDDDCNAVLYPCLSVVSRKQGSDFTRIFTENTLMFSDISMFEMLQIVAKVIGDSLGSFLHEIPGLTTASLPGNQ